MQKDITHVALDDSKNSIVAGILRPKATEPELRQFPNAPKHFRRFGTRTFANGARFPKVISLRGQPSSTDCDLPSRVRSASVRCRMPFPPRGRCRR